MGQRGNPRRLLVVAVDHLPRRPTRVGEPEHLVHRVEIIRPPRTVAIILCAGLPTLPRIVQPVGEALGLFGLRYMDEELDEVGAAAETGRASCRERVCQYV